MTGQSLQFGFPSRLFEAGSKTIKSLKTASTQSTNTRTLAARPAASMTVRVE